MKRYKIISKTPQNDLTLFKFHNLVKLKLQGCVCMSVRPMLIGCWTYVIMSSKHYKTTNNQRSGSPLVH